MSRRGWTLARSCALGVAIVSGAGCALDVRLEDLVLVLVEGRGLRSFLLGVVAVNGDAFAPVDFASNQPIM